VRSIPLALAVWVVSGALTLIGSMVCAELSSRFSRTGGVYVFLKETFGSGVGFLWGWAMFWTMHSGIIAFIAIIFARFTAYFLPLGDWGMKGVAIGAIAVLSAVNYAGVRHGSTLQALFTAGKVLAVVLIIVLGFTLGARLPRHFVGPSEPAAVSLGGFLTAMIAGLSAFGGWHMVTYNAGETVAPERTIPRALILGTLIVTACYVLMNAVYFYVLPLDEVAGSTRVAADAADALLGFGGGAIMSGIVMFSTFGALSGIVLAGPRVYYAMGQDGLAFRWFAAVHPRFRTPHRAIVLQGLWSAVLVATGTFRTLFTRVIYTEWIFFALMTVGLMLLRRRGAPAGYRMWGYPVLPVAFVAASLAVVLNHVVTSPGESAFGFSLVASGIPVYLLWTRHSGSGEAAS
jgi:APA family basic amino acid/polyamine antiporter